MSSVLFLSINILHSSYQARVTNTECMSSNTRKQQLSYRLLTSRLSGCQVLSSVTPPKKLLDISNSTLAMVNRNAAQRPLKRHGTVCAVVEIALP